MTIFFYILKEYLKYVVGTIVLTVFLFVLFDFIHKTTKYFVDYNPSTETIIKFYVYQIPAQITQALPIAGLLASVISMILLSRTNEITAMRAAGMSPLQIGLPLAAGGLLLSLSSLLIGELFVPRYAQKVHYIQQVQIEGEKDEHFLSGTKWLRDGQRLIHFQDFDPIAQKLTQVHVVDVRPNFRPAKAVEAQTGTYDSVAKVWHLKDVKVLTFKANGTLAHVVHEKNQLLHLPVEPQKLKKDPRKPNEMSFKELTELIDRGDQSGADTLPYKVDLHGKFAYPFAAFVVSLVGLKFGYKSERATETAKGVLLAFFIGISYWFVMSAGRALGLRGDLHPFVAAWLANAVVLVVIVFDAWMSRRS